MEPTGRWITVNSQNKKIEVLQGECSNKEKTKYYINDTVLRELYLPDPHVGGARLMTVWLGGGGGQQTPRGSAVIVGWVSLMLPADVGPTWLG